MNSVAHRVNEWTTTIRDLEESKRRETRELEERFRQEMIAPREQIKRLEDKLQTTQRQVTELVKDLQMSQDKMNATDSAKRVSCYYCASCSFVVPSLFPRCSLVVPSLFP